MSSRKRLHREDPGRSSPIRDFSNLYRSSDSSNDRGEPGNESSHKPTSGSSSDGASMTDGVALAYRVIEKHISEGRRSAEQLNRQPYATRPVTDSLQELLERVLRFQSEMLPLWLKVLGTLVSVDPARTPYSAGADAGQWTNGASNNRATAVSIEVASARPVRVSLELRETSDGLLLMAHALRAVDPAKPPLSGISFVSAQNHGCSTLRILIPDDQPPGLYSGVVVDREKGETQGTLSVRIAE